MSCNKIGYNLTVLTITFHSFGAIWRVTLLKLPCLSQSPTCFDGAGEEKPHIWNGKALMGGLTVTQLSQ